MLDTDLSAFITVSGLLYKNSLVWRSIEKFVVVVPLSNSQNFTKHLFRLGNKYVR